MKQEDIDYFNRGRDENPEFWKNLSGGGGKPDFKDAVVVDVGCGHGSLCIDIAKLGAKKVIGIDLDEKRIDFANENLKKNYPELINTVEFKVMDVRDLKESNIDYFVSKDTFEHIIELKEVLSSMIDKLRSDPDKKGRIYLGFGPLWNSPEGAHERYEMPIRNWWSHLLFSEEYYINRLNKKRSLENQISSTYDLGLNKLSLAQYKKIFNECGANIIYFRVNKITSIPNRFFSILAKIPILEEYCSLHIFCILEK